MDWKGARMATMPELVAVLENHRVDTGATLELFGRRLREASRVTKGKRGRGAAQMTYLDAARLLIACAATDHPERAVDAEYEFSNTLLHLDRGDTTHFLDAHSAPTLDKALASVLEGFANGAIDDAERDRRNELMPGADTFNIPVMPVVWLIVHRSGVQAQLRVRDETFHYAHRALIAIGNAQPGNDLTERARDYEHATTRFRGGKNLRAELDSGLLRAVANLIGGAPASRSMSLPASVTALLETHRHG